MAFIKIKYILNTFDFRKKMNPKKKCLKHQDTYTPKLKSKYQRMPKRENETHEMLKSIKQKF